MSPNPRRNQPVVLKRFLRLLLLSCLAVYLVALAMVGFNQRRFIYGPPVYTTEQADRMAASANLERWTNSSGGLVGLKRQSPNQPASGLVLIVYGNASDAVASAHYADAIQGVAAFDVFILEYPGYADRPGSPSQDSLFRAADEAFQLLDTNKPVFVLGESLGSGVAAYLAGTCPAGVAGLILISPYNRLTDVAQYHMPLLPVHLLLVDRFPSEDYLRNYHGPVGVVVDGNDRVVPEQFGLRLYNGYAGPKRLWEFPIGEHAAIAGRPEKFWREVVEFWRTDRSSQQ